MRCEAGDELDREAGLASPAETMAARHRGRQLDRSTHRSSRSIDSNHVPIAGSQCPGSAVEEKKGRGKLATREGSAGADLR